MRLFPFWYSLSGLARTNLALRFAGAFIATAAVVFVGTFGTILKLVAAGLAMFVLGFGIRESKLRAQRDAAEKAKTEKSLASLAEQSQQMEAWIKNSRRY